MRGWATRRAALLICRFVRPPRPFAPAAAAAAGPTDSSPPLTRQARDANATGTSSQHSVPEPEKGAEASEYAVAYLPAHTSLTGFVDWRARAAATTDEPLLRRRSSGPSSSGTTCLPIDQHLASNARRPPAPERTLLARILSGQTGAYRRSPYRSTGARPTTPSDLIALDASSPLCSA